MKKYYGFYGGKLSGVYDEETAKEIFAAYGNGLSEDLSEIRARGGLVHREELDNQFQFKGYLGPMWDGNRYLVNGEMKYEWEVSDEEKENCERCAILRYETQEVYDALSR